MNSKKTDSNESWLEDVPLTDMESARRTRVLQDQILDELRKIIDPDLNKDIVSLGFVKKLYINEQSKSVSFTLELTTLACPVKDVFVDQATNYLKSIEGIDHVTIEIDAMKSAADKDYVGHENAADNLKSVSHILAITSGKGGVGKSTCCVNLAYALSNRGARVGIVDCDVYGPSLGKLVNVLNPVVYYTVPTVDRAALSKSELDEVNSTQALQQSNGVILPLESKGVKLMSYAFMRKKGHEYAAVRGPLASSLVYQMVTQTKWGDLDYLLLDLPPGTGDIHLTIAQTVPLSGAIVISTGHALSRIDVLKGIHMYSNLKIPTLALLENMSTVVCNKCENEQELWGDGGDNNEGQNNNYKINSDDDSFSDEELKNEKGIHELLQQFGIPIHTKLPLNREFSRLHKKVNKQIQFPFVNFCKESNIVNIRLQSFVDQIVRELARLRFGGSSVPDVGQTNDGMLTITYKENKPSLLNDKNIIDKGNEAGYMSSDNTITPQSIPIYTNNNNDNVSRIFTILPREVRLKCRCALCIDEFTHRSKINARTIPLNLHATKITQTGNYAVSFTWSDGHESIMSFDILKKIAEESEEANSLQTVSPINDYSTSKIQNDCGTLAELAEF